MKKAPAPETIFHITLGLADTEWMCVCTRVCVCVRVARVTRSSQGI